MAVTAVPIHGGEFRKRLTDKLAHGATDMFALAVQKCPCVHYLNLHAFEKSFLRFRHLKDLYHGHTLYFDSGTQIPVPVHEWQDRLVAATLSAMHIRPCTGLEDILTYRLYLCCAEDTEHEPTPETVSKASTTQPLSFLYFCHLKALYPEYTVYFDSGTQIPVPVEDWQNRSIAETLSALQIRSRTDVGDIPIYHLYLCRTQSPGAAPTKETLDVIISAEESLLPVVVRPAL